MNPRKFAAAALIPSAATGIALAGCGAAHQSSGQLSKHAAQVQAAHTKSASPSSSPSATPKLKPHHRAAHKPAKHHATAHRAAAHHAAAPRSMATQPPAPPAPAQPPAPQPVPQQTQPPTASSGGSLTSGMSSFEQCVAFRESGDNPTASSAGMFGILPATWASLGFPGTAGQASVATQKAAFAKLYAEDGTQPWAPYDGC